MGTKALNSSRKVKIGTILDKDVIEKLKERAHRERRSISSVIENAVMHYEQTETLDRELKRRAFGKLLSVKFNISKQDWKAILDDDYYEQ